jgi:hypothetical protein
MKVGSKLLFVNLENEIVCGDGSFKATVIHQIIASKGEEGKVDIDVEFMDIENISFMGMPIKGYNGYKEFKAKMSEMGIDIEEMVDEACVGIISNEVIESVKNDFKKIMG